MKRLVPLGLLLSLVTVVLYGCYVVPAPPPVAGVRPPPPPHVTATPHRGWVYGQGWDG
jgi:hypothetical protein